MQLFHQLPRNRRRMIGWLIIAALISGILICARRAVKPEEYAVYAAAISPDRILYYETFEGVDLDPALAEPARLSLTSGDGWGNRVSRVTFTDNGTRAWVRVGFSACVPDHSYIMGYNLIKDSAGWHKDGHSQLLQEVFC